MSMIISRVKGIYRLSILVNHSTSCCMHALYLWLLLVQTTGIISIISLCQTVFCVKGRLSMRPGIRLLRFTIQNSYCWLCSCADFTDSEEIEYCVVKMLIIYVIDFLLWLSTFSSACIMDSLCDSGAWVLDATSESWMMEASMVKEEKGSWVSRHIYCL